MAILVQRKTLVGVSTEFSFNQVGLKFLVKNLSNDDCFVNFEPITNDNEDSSIKVPSKIAQLILTNEHQPTAFNSIFVKGTGEVEVQIVLW